jgi:hypothetical protein
VGVPIYLGVGGVIAGPRSNFGDNLALGVRVPFGLAIQFRRAPVQLFFELAVRLLFVREGNNNYDRTDLTGGLGFRVYF